VYPDQQLENGTTDHEVGTQGCTLQGSLERIVTLLSPLEMTLFSFVLSGFTVHLLLFQVLLHCFATILHAPLLLMHGVAAEVCMLQ